MIVQWHSSNRVPLIESFVFLLVRLIIYMIITGKKPDIIRVHKTALDWHTPMVSWLAVSPRC